MGKKTSRPQYISKGERRSVSKKITNALRRDFLATPSIDSIFQAMNYKTLMLSKTKDKKVVEIHKKLIEKDKVTRKAAELLKRYNRAGLTWAGAIQAVKTDFITAIDLKYGRIKAESDETDK